MVGPYSFIRSTLQKFSLITATNILLITFATLLQTQLTYCPSIRAQKRVSTLLQILRFQILLTLLVSECWSQHISIWQIVFHNPSLACFTNLTPFAKIGQLLFHGLLAFQLITFMNSIVLVESPALLYYPKRFSHTHTRQHLSWLRFSLRNYESRAAGLSQPKSKHRNHTKLVEILLSSFLFIFCVFPPRGSHVATSTPRTAHCLTHIPSLTFLYSHLLHSLLQCAVPVSHPLTVTVLSIIVGSASMSTLEHMFNLFSISIEWPILRRVAPTYPLPAQLLWNFQSLNLSKVSIHILDIRLQMLPCTQSRSPTPYPLRASI